MYILLSLSRHCSTLLWHMKGVYSSLLMTLSNRESPSIQISSSMKIKSWLCGKTCLYFSLFWGLLYITRGSPSLEIFSQLKPLQWSSCGGSRLRGRKPTTWLDCSAFAWSLSSSSSPLSLSLSSSSLPSNFVLHKKALNDIPVWHITYCRPSKPLSARGRRSKSQQGSINFFVHPQILGRVR